MISKLAFWENELQIAILDFFHQVPSQFLFPINSKPFEMISILHPLSKSSGKPQGAQMVAGLW